MSQNFVPAKGHLKLSVVLVEFAQIFLEVKHLFPYREVPSGSEIFDAIGESGFKVASDQGQLNVPEDGSVEAGPVLSVVAPESESDEGDVVNLLTIETPNSLFVRSQLRAGSAFDPLNRSPTMSVNLQKCCPLVLVHWSSP